MEEIQRKGDLRIYIVIFLFLSCIITGGLLLGLYLLISDPNVLYLQLGMFFVAVPWLFWLLGYLYSCVVKPCAVAISRSASDFDLEKGQKNFNNNHNVSEKEMEKDSKLGSVDEAKLNSRSGENPIENK